MTLANQAHLHVQRGTSRQTPRPIHPSILSPETATRAEHDRQATYHTPHISHLTPTHNLTMGSTTTTDLPIVYRDKTSREDFIEAAWSRTHNVRRPVDARVPRAVVHATEAGHVAQAVRLARELGCRVSVRSGGHSWAQWSVRDDAVLVDLGSLPGGKHSAQARGGGGVLLEEHGEGKVGLVFDERTKIVGCPPSTTGRVLNRFLEGKGRLFAGGHCPDVGLGGFLLQGGMGWNCKNWGWACESIVGLDAVTARGEEVYCSATENADLFWAARGAGPGEFCLCVSLAVLEEVEEALLCWPLCVYAMRTRLTRIYRLPGDRDEILSHDESTDAHVAESLHLSHVGVQESTTMGHRRE